MKDLGLLKYFLGIEVLRSKRGIFINQRKYVLDLLAETEMLDCKPADTPMVQNHGLQIVERAEPTHRTRYQRLVDADWAGNPNDRKSTAGYFTFVGGNLVTWRSKKQKVVALSSAEAEFRGIKSGLTEILWLKRLMTELELMPSGPCKLFCDNKAAISISENPVQHDRTKHVEVDRHFIKDNIEAKVVELPFVRSEDQLADILTKAVDSRSFHEEHCCILGAIPFFALKEGAAMVVKR
ncbi:uncharacterized mitochondrial protein AtMg00810-like [Salvia splendens]|uniref:uncharacterized mitochondrial protein AtMg00810-like n=1 Tax=Salvia splendens TaxID=180675 RepID=UPI001C274C5D|nr:uncharacterized mitochondrial protein AtMg00810-like [Salvia splendens]